MLAVVEDDSDEDFAPASVVIAKPLATGRVDMKLPGVGSCKRCGGTLVQTGKCTMCSSCGDTGGCG